MSGFSVGVDLGNPGHLFALGDRRRAVSVARADGAGGHLFARPGLKDENCCAATRPRFGRAAEVGRLRDRVAGPGACRWGYARHPSRRAGRERAAQSAGSRSTLPARAVMSGYREIGRGDTIPAAVSGHAFGGGPSSDPHLAIAPLAFIGAPYASGAVFAFALLPPRQMNIFADETFRCAMHAISRVDGKSGRRVVRVYNATFDLTFAFGNESQRSLDREPYLSEAPAWATCTPIVLDRHLKASSDAVRQGEIDA